MSDSDHDWAPDEDAVKAAGEEPPKAAFSSQPKQKQAELESAMEEFLRKCALYCQLLGQSVLEVQEDAEKGDLHLPAEDADQGAAAGPARAGVKRRRSAASRRGAAAPGKVRRAASAREARDAAGEGAAAAEDEDGVIGRLLGGRLRPYQRKGVKWLVKLFENAMSGILADEMGLGKTVQVAGLLEYIRVQRAYPRPWLVVAPLSTAGNWRREFERFVPGVPVLVYHGSPEERARMRDEVLRPGDREHHATAAFPVVVTTYELALRDESTLARIDWQFLIVDEGHRLKNRHAKLLKSLKALPSQHRLLLTGTPLQNNLGELWTLLNFCCPELFENVSNFDSWFDFNLDTKASQQVEAASVQRLHMALKPLMLRRVKANVRLALPRKREVVVFADRAPAQVEMLRDMRADRAAFAARVRKLLAEERAYSGGSLRNPMVQERKLAQHPFLVYEDLGAGGEAADGAALLAASGKLQLLDRMLTRLRADGHRVLVFSQYTRLLEILEDYLTWRGWEYCKIVGDTALEDRDAEMEAFHATGSKKFVFLLSTRAGGQGINLVGADTVVLFDSDWNPHMDAQAQDRAHRIGQTRDVAVFRLITAESVEVRMLEAAQRKLRLEKLVMKGGYGTSVAERDDVDLESLRDFSAFAAVADTAGDVDLTDVLDTEVEDTVKRARGGITDAELVRLTDRKALFDESIPMRGDGYLVLY